MLLHKCEFRLESTDTLLLKGETMFTRSSGVLMHITSLPSQFGIGTFGKSAYDFVDFLEETKQTYWQNFTTYNY